MQSSMKRYTLWATAALAGFISCDDPFEDSTFVTPTNLEAEMTCTTVLEKYDETFSLWLELLHYTDYYNGLKDADAKATLFAPTNQAMEEFLAWKGVSSVQELDLTYAQYVVQTHIINQTKIGSESFVNQAEAGVSFEYASLFQGYITPTFGYKITDVDDAFRSDSVYEAGTIFLNNQAAVQPRDSGGVHMIEAVNANIYYMDDVIRPLAETMVDKLEAMEEYSIFVAAARESGYDKEVEKLNDTIRIAGGGYSIKTYQFTCFAPNDEAFQREGIHSVEDLKAKIGGGEKALYDFVSYHFYDRLYTTAQFFNFDAPDQVLIYDTNCTTEVMTCQNDSSTGVYVPIINEKAKVLRSNVEARNGLIHKIDYYLPVWQPEPVEVKWDFCNSSDIISFVNSYGAEKNLGMLYSTPLSNKEYQIALAPELDKSWRDNGPYGEITSFTCQTNETKASSSNYRRVGFKKCKYVSSRDKENNPYGAYLNNLLVLNLGYAGWIQFQTPTIIKGKYKVTLHYASEATMKNFHAAGSLTKFQLDPEKETSWTENKYVFKGLPTKMYTYGSADLEIFREVEFESSGVHTFKATMLDINAKTSGSYHQLWDYVLFTPIQD